MLTYAHILGLPNLSPTDQQKVRLGDSTMTSSCRIIKACIPAQVCRFLENPAGSMMWKAPFLFRLCSHVSSVSFVCDFCQYGARWRKRTRIQGWNVQSINHLNCICHGRKGICSRTHKYHIVLKGQDPPTRQLWTHLAQPYRLKFARHAADALIDSHETLDAFLTKRFWSLNLWPSVISSAYGQFQFRQVEYGCASEWLLASSNGARFIFNP